MYLLHENSLCTECFTKTYVGVYSTIEKAIEQMKYDDNYIYRLELDKPFDVLNPILVQCNDVTIITSPQELEKLNKEDVPDLLPFGTNCHFDEPRLFLFVSEKLNGLYGRTFQRKSYSKFLWNTGSNVKYLHAIQLDSITPTVYFDINNNDRYIFDEKSDKYVPITLKEIVSKFSR